VKLIDKQQRKLIYTDFEDELGRETPVELPVFVAADSLEKFRDRTRAFLRAHQDRLTIRKLRMNEPLTPLDLDELERMLSESGFANSNHLEKAKAESNGLGLFVRSLVGLDREAAKQALAHFMAGKTLSANQIEFVNLIVDHLIKNGVMNPELLYESPFTDLNPLGPEGIFNSTQVDELISLLSELRSRAVA
jgi:type I restriction enzyme, R subunit